MFLGHHPLLWAPTNQISFNEDKISARAYINDRVLGASLPLSSSFGLTLDTLNQLWNILLSFVYVLPNEFISVGCGASIAASSANENLAVIL